MDTNLTNKTATTGSTVGTNKQLVAGLIGALAAVLLTALAFGGYIYLNNQQHQKDVAELNSEIDSLKAGKCNADVTVTPTETSSTTDTPATTITPASSEIPSDWVKFQDTNAFGISFYHPKEWSPYVSTGVTNIIGDETLSVAMPNSAIDLGVGLFFDHSVDSTKGECDRTYCTIDNVKILGKTSTIDISGETTNDKVIPANPRLPKSGVDGYLQFTVQDPVIKTEKDVQNLKILLESISYN